MVPGNRRGGLDKGGADAVGGVVVARYHSNPMEVIANVKKKIEEISAGLPSRKLADGTVSKVTIVPFYDRSGLIQETVGTLAGCTHARNLNQHNRHHRPVDEPQSLNLSLGVIATGSPHDLYHHALSWVWMPIS